MLGATLAGLVLWNAAATATAATAAAPAPAPPPIEAFLARPEINGMRLSPSGRYLASIQRRGTGQAVVVLDRQTGERRTATYGGSERIGFDWIEWKGDDRLLLRAWLFEVVRANDRPDGAVTGYRYGRFVEAVDRDGGHLVVMLQNTPAAEQSNAPFLSFLDLLPGDPDHVLINAPSAQGASSVWKASVSTGAGELVQAGDFNTVGWGVDGTGAVVMRTELRDGAFAFEARDAAGAWQEVMRAEAPGPKALADVEILGPAPGAGQVYVAARPAPGAAGEGDTRTLRIYDVAGRTLSPPLWPALRYDISSIVYRPGGRQAAAACYVADVFTCDFKDPALQAQFQGVSRYFGGRRNLQPASMSDDLKLWVLSVTGADQAGAYHLFDADRHDVALVGDRYPGLPEAALGPAERLDIKARDGTVVPVYLTRPPTAPSGPLPMVVLVHDGPGTRASLDFDPLVQYLATRGYLVLQPNFRGSGGYGRAWRQAGERQWGGLMQDDVTDATKALIAAGRADPARICIIGGGYGGYAALQAGATEPGLYRCVASWGGASDLPALLRWERKAGGGVAYRRHLASIGDPGADRERLARVSPISHAADYRPPVLLIHGAEDEVIPPEQSKAMAAALTRAGKQVELMVFDGEGHGDFSETHTKTMWAALAGFLAKAIGPASPPQ